MDFKDQIKQISERVEKMRENLTTEEATKNALIMPFIQALGYDVFNPLEVVPEFTCDIGTKKGEKIDYAIFKEKEPIILIECKHWQQDLNLHDNQLLRYFNVSKALFGILTNGIIYRFYTDLAEPNKMDEKPFLEINMLDLKDVQIEEVKKFHKSYFDAETIFNSASELKYMNELKSVISNEFTNPSKDFVLLIGKKIYDGRFTDKILEQFTTFVRRSISQHINDLISDRLKAAINEEENNKVQNEIQQQEQPKDENKIVTTESEIEAFFIVKSILHNDVSPDRVTYRDAQSYCAILLDDTNRKIICRLYFNNESNKSIGIMDTDKKEVRYKIATLDEIYNYADKLIEIAKIYLNVTTA